MDFIIARFPYCIVHAGSVSFCGKIVVSSHATNCIYIEVLKLHVDLCSSHLYTSYSSYVASKLLSKSNVIYDNSCL